MAKAELTRSGDIKVEREEGSTFRINAKKDKQQRRTSALTKAKYFLANYPEDVINLLNEDISEDIGITTNEDFIAVVNAVRYSGLGRGRFEKVVSQVVKNSPNSPTREVGQLIASRFTEVVYAQAEDLRLKALGQKKNVYFVIG